MAYIRTYTGRRVDLFNFKKSDIDIRDIAFGLAHFNRFNGHAGPCNVAQHSVFVAILARGGRDVQKQALLHDASEAYIGDMTKWLKESPMMEGYRELEDTIQRVIYEHFGCPLVMLPEVKRADKLMVRYEMTMAWGDFEPPDPRYGPLTKAELEMMPAWKPWSPKFSNECFYMLFENIHRGIPAELPVTA